MQLSPWPGEGVTSKQTEGKTNQDDSGHRHHAAGGGGAYARRLAGIGRWALDGAPGYLREGLSTQHRGPRWLLSRVVWRHGAPACPPPHLWSRAGPG